MTKEALQKLRDTLAQGTKYATMGHTRLCQLAFPPRFEGDHGRESSAQLAVNAWNQGCLTAAKMLHERLTPDWEYWLNSRQGTRYASMGHTRHCWDDPEGPMAVMNKRTSFIDLQAVSGEHDDMACAWLIAIIEAKLKELEHADPDHPVL